MSDAARRKERKRLKREKTKADRRKALSISPYKRLGSAGEIEACYINADWQTSGIASIQCIRINPTGGFAMAGFLIDLWCAGLKDAWGHLNLFQQNIDHNLEVTRRHYDLVRIQPDAARTIVAGAIRFARQNGFRLPPKYDRWVNLLGQVPDPATADLTPFGKDGGLLWVGPMDDLRGRLIGCSLDEFLAKPNVHFMTEINRLDEDLIDPDLDDDPIDEDFEEVLRQIAEIAHGLAPAIAELSDQKFGDLQQRCAESGEEPSPIMREALTAILTAAVARDLDREQSKEIISDARFLMHSEPRLKEYCDDCLDEAILQVVRLISDAPRPHEIASPSPIPSVSGPPQIP